MFNKTKRITAAKICFFVFFAKMLIAATPIFVNVLNTGTVLQVVMQLEIELSSNNTNTNNEDLHEHGIKIFKPDAISYLLNPHIENNGKQIKYIRDEKLICYYTGSVPTPPPNC